MDKKRRVLETLKTLLILALTCSALWLLTDSQLFGQLSGILSYEQEGGGQGSASGQSRSVVPLRMAAMSQGGCYGVQYHGEELSALFDRTAPLLNEAVSSTGAPQPISQEDWERALLSDPAIYFDFQGVLPLQVLSGWLSGRENPELTARVRYLLLAAGEGGEVRLCYRDEDLGQFFSCPTELVSLAQLQSVAAGVMANGAIFACQSEEYDQLAPYTLVSARTPTPPEFLAANPLDEHEEERLEALLDTLSFPLGITTIYDTPEGRRVRSGNDTLTISNGGVLTYHSGREEERYPIVQREGYSPVFAAAETARELVNDVVQPWLGDARLYLRQIATRGNGWLIEFGYALNETPVQMDQRGYAARVLVEEGHVSEFEIQLRTYTVQEQTTLILPQPQAAAALVQMDRAGSALQLCYRDQGEIVRASWTAD